MNTEQQWLDEPDRVEFKYKGYDCLVHRNPIQELGNLCGYVALPKSHPLHGKSHDEIDISIHGGLTYSSACQGLICHKPQNGADDNVWWIGFDCAHSGDLIPGIYKLRLPGGILYDVWKDFPKNFETYKTIEYVQDEIKDLVDQLEEMA